MFEVQTKSHKCKSREKKKKETQIDGQFSENFPDLVVLTVEDWNGFLNILMSRWVEPTLWINVGVLWHSGLLIVLGSVVKPK